MLKKRVEEVLNQQIEKEAYSSQLYLAMASWAEQNGYSGSSDWLFRQSNEEREHMLKLFHYINDRGGSAIVSKLEQPPKTYNSLNEIFESVYKHELFISQSINELVGVCIEEKDYTTQQFLQWYVEEQIEEESTAQKILDKLNLLGDDKARLYMFDNDIEKFGVSNNTDTQL